MKGSVTYGLAADFSFMIDILLAHAHAHARFAWKRSSYHIPERKYPRTVNQKPDPGNDIYCASLLQPVHILVV